MCIRDSAYIIFTATFSVKTVFVIYAYKVCLSLLKPEIPFNILLYIIYYSSRLCHSESDNMIWIYYVVAFVTEKRCEVICYLHVVSFLSYV